MQSIDAKTVEQLKAGDEKAYRLVYERYRKGVFAFCYRMMLDAEAAADVTQDVFVKVLSQIATLEDPQAFSSWLFAIARNEVYSFYRNSREHRSLTENDVWESETPLDRLIAAESATRIQNFIAALQPIYREAIVLREYEGLSYTQIAQVTGCTEGAVKARLFKARKALVERMMPFFEKE
jgi:RNA polymerase sigma-70 factor, ECF subfamily